ncbi:MAG: hypothetical protein PHI64_12770 [Zoogloea sp.]|nr:hypothetical protein [Zoogloea sp.]MDD2989821.1 hypothetical protein [Zoogloea sp.]
MSLHPHAAAALEAAEFRASRGRFATLRFLRKRGVPLRLYQLACALRGEE